MTININIEKKHVYLLSVLIVVFGTVSFVQSQGVNNFGHDAGDVNVVLANGTSTTLQTAVSNGWIGGGAGGANLWSDDGSGNINYSGGAVGVGGVDATPAWGSDSDLYVEGVLEIANTSSSVSRYGQISADSNSLNLRWQRSDYVIGVTANGNIVLPISGSSLSTGGSCSGTSEDSGAIAYNGTDLFLCNNAQNWERIHST
jgi:hypothetical protein